ncbi:MAG: 50S ribosomal protein L4 [Candidatus Harrisonbacteria bacterium CG10_big_fil_rev_8_21_14_0_10_38_8]|uniref:Large ribosomal subunit protein uL4 n=1 Tax=Candidatus Harrisonbacteria bacterium CG10_big_fil_rev_8_21_14_0_10_38_8 TaxID=1974582 RepID=A0A2M6WK94_9BACT|nr:MAG: 50S ribosomal protein L4 [Candidatus Harrisonbacteria bacterium CG10_big_fil_rev_8_21_14_0_10_38_8]
MKLDILDLNAKKVGDIEVSDDIFNAKWNADLVHQAFVTKQANARSPWAHIKGRGDVRGGGKKPWKQKGTGRARHGSIRSPIWVGGGVAHGPTNQRDYTKKLPKKMAKAALYSVLSRKIADGELRIVNSLAVKDAKTKELATGLRGFFSSKTVPSTLLISVKENKQVVKASNNIPKVKNVTAENIGIVDLLNYKNVLVDQEAVTQIK